MPKQTAIITDDEQAARLLIRQYLANYSDIEIVAECANGPEAVAAIDRLEPSLLFLDIQMPGMNGFKVLQEVKHIPKVIFTTAYDSFAIKAFEHNAVDYLLKPYTKGRFDIAVTRVLGANDITPIRTLTEGLQPPGIYPERILVEKSNRLVNIQVADILYLKAEKDYTRIHTAEHAYLGTYGISQMEQKLNPQSFIRVHRSFIVNVNHIKELYKDIRQYMIMTDGTEISIGRNYLNNIKKLIF